MPLIIIKMIKGRNTDVKRKLIQQVTAAVQEVLHPESEHISIIIDEIEQTNMGTNGKMLADVITTHHNDNTF
jgi:4-oxalocrotonate tautomerase family enzyme